MLQGTSVEVLTTADKEGTLVLRGNVDEIIEVSVCGELVVSPVVGDTVCFPQTPLFADSGATCETDIHTLTYAAQTSNDGSLKVIAASDADVCATWNKEIEILFKLPSPHKPIKGNLRLTGCLPARI